MSTLLISLLTLLLLVISAFVVLVVLMQRTSQSGGMGAALGGGAAESAFGAETNNVLTKATIYGIISFFIVALGLYLFYQARYADRDVQTLDATSLIQAEESAAVENDGVAGTLPALQESVEPAVTSEANVVEAETMTESTEAVPAANDAK